MVTLKSSSYELRPGTRVRTLVHVTCDGDAHIAIGDHGTVLETFPPNLLRTIFGEASASWGYSVHFDTDPIAPDLDEGIYMRQTEIEPLD